MCRLRHINDSVLLSLKMEGIRLIFLSHCAFFCFSANSVSVEVEACSSNFRFNLYCLLYSAFLFLLSNGMTRISNGQWPRCDVTNLCVEYAVNKVI
jgi:hypothetical protein